MFFFRKALGKAVLMLEVQSSIVRASLIWSRPGKPPYILYDQSRFVPHSHNAGNDKLVAASLKALEASVDEAHRYFMLLSKEPSLEGMPRRIAEAHFVLSSPWMISRARTISVSSGKPVKATRAYVESLLAEERRALEKEGKGAYKIIEEKVFEVKLNGYPVSDWADRETTELSISYAVTAGGETIERFREACRRAIRPGAISFHSSLLLEYAGMRVLKPDEHSYAILNIHGRLTDIAVVRNGVCVFFGSFPVGTRAIVKDLAGIMQSDAGTAESALSLSLGGRLDERHAATIADAVKKAAEPWTGECMRVLADAGYGKGTPLKAVIASRDHEPLFVEALRRAYPGSDPSVLSIDDVALKVSFDPKAEQLRMVGLYAAAIESLSM